MKRETTIKIRMIVTIFPHYLWLLVSVVHLHFFKIYSYGNRNGKGITDSFCFSDELLNQLLRKGKFSQQHKLAFV